TPAELEALTRPASAAEVDSWAEALDEEFERRVAGDETVPDWYLEAMERADALGSQEVPAVQSPEPEPAQAEVESISFAEAMPDWLGNMAPEEPAAEALPGEIPDWLRSVAPEPPAAIPTPVISAIPVPAIPAASANDWLAGLTDETLPAEIP